MFHENLKTLRIEKGMSQQFLADQLHVTRQTISKWERGLSVPDADMLIALSEMFEVSVSTLLNRSINEEDTLENTLLAEKLEQLNLQLAQRNQRSRKVWKVIRFIAIACLVFGILCILLNAVAMKSYQAVEASVVEITAVSYTHLDLWDSQVRPSQIQTSPSSAY